MSQLPQEFNSPLAAADPEIAAVLQAELDRQRNFLEMILSELFHLAPQQRVFFLPHLALHDVFGIATVQHTLQRIIRTF